MKQQQSIEECFYQFPVNPQSSRIAGKAIQLYEDTLAQAREGRLTPEKWTLAHETMQQVKDKLNAISQPQEGGSIWFTYDETWAFSIAIRLCLHHLNALPPNPSYPEDAGCCLLIDYSCAEVLEKEA